MIEHNNNNEESLTLKDLMERAGLTEPVLSRRIGVGIRTIGYWKVKSQVPRLDNALALARELNVSVKTLAKALGLDTESVPDDFSDNV